MKSFFFPESIAVVGASPNPSKGGNAILRNVIRGFNGSIYPINPNYQEIEGLTCYAKVSDIGKSVEMVSIFVAAALVPEVLRDCGKAGVTRAIIQSGGFSEAGEEGIALQEECIAIGKEFGIRLWGPNCMGLMDAKNSFVCSFLTPELWADGLIPGDVSLITQSGTLAGAFIVDLMSHGTMGVSKACSIGNKMDVDECELMEYLIEDPDTSVIALFLESIPQGRRFLELAGRSPKPIVVLKGGQSEKGAMAAMSHTASLAGDDTVTREALAQYGVILANDFHHMMDIARALATVPQGITAERVAALTFSGGAGIMAADLLDRQGIDLPTLSNDTLSRLEAIFPSWANAANPIDLWALVEQVGGSQAYLQCAEIALDDNVVDALLLLAFTGGFDLDLDLEALASLSRQKGKPIFFWVIGPQDNVKEFQQRVQSHGMLAYREISRAAEAMQAVCDRARRCESVALAQQEKPYVDNLGSAVAGILESTSSEAGVMDEYDAKKVLSEVGIPTVPEEMASDVEHAQAIAERFGYPVVLKGIIPGEIHKTEKNLVVLDLRSAGELTTAFGGLLNRMEGQGQVLVQKFAKADVELICGMMRDPDFGPTIMFGMGGVMAEVYKDVVFRVAPLNEATAMEMMNSIEAKEVLDGFRGRKAVSRDALAKVLVALSRIGSEVPQISQIDINPLAVVEGQLMALDATVITDTA